MRQKPGTQKAPAEKVVKDIRRRSRKQHSAEEKIRIVLEGLRGEDSIAGYNIAIHGQGEACLSCALAPLPASQK